MLGPHHLNEVFLDGVEVFPDEVLGELGDGWRVMREALAFERVGIARYARCESLLDRMQTELGDNWDELPESIRARWVRALIDLRIARLLAYRAVSLQDDPSAGAAASAARIATTTCDQQVAELLFDVLGPDGAGQRLARRRCTAPSKTTGVTPRRPRSRPEPSKCSGCSSRGKHLGSSRMKTALPEDIAEFSAVATKRLARFGGPQAALQSRD